MTEEYDELVDKKTCFVIIYYINLSEIIGDFVYLREKVKNPYFNIKKIDIKITENCYKNIFLNCE